MRLLWFNFRKQFAITCFRSAIQTDHDDNPNCLPLRHQSLPIYLGRFMLQMLGVLACAASMYLTGANTWPVFSAS